MGDRELSRAMFLIWLVNMNEFTHGTPNLLKYEGALSSPVYVEINNGIRKILDEQMHESIKSLKDNKKYLNAITEKSAKNERFNGEEVKHLFAQ